MEFIKRKKRKLQTKHLKTEHLWNQYSEFVLNVCYSRTKDLSMSKDIRQEVFLRIKQNISSFKGKSSIKTWIHSITQNCCADKLNSIRKNRDFMQEYRHNYSLERSQDFVAESKKVSWDYKDHCKQNSCPVSKAMFELHFKDGWNFQDISLIFGYSETMIKKMILSCLDKPENISYSK